MAWTKACPASLSAGACKGVTLNGISVAIYNIDGQLHATSNVCTHQEALLTEGYLEGEFIECPLHQGRFNVVTGAPDGSMVTEPIRVFPIRVEAGHIEVDTDTAS